MVRRWVVNASPIIVLCKAGAINAITGVCTELIVPSGVAEEIAQGPPGDPAVEWLLSSGRKLIQDVGLVDARVSAFDLGKGESQVISVALETPGAWAVVDDRAARRCADTLIVPVLGTLGVLLAAKKQGNIPAVAPILDCIVECGFRVSEPVKKSILRLAGE